MSVPRGSEQPPSLLYIATVSATLRHFLGPYARHLRARGWRVDAAASGVTADTVLRDAFDEAHEIPLSRSIVDVPAMILGYRAVARVLATQPDIVHVHTPIASFITRLAVRRMSADRRPAVVYTAHGFHFHRGGHWAANGLFLLVERLAGRWTDRLIVINEEDFAAAIRHRLVAAARIVRMPGIGLDTDVFDRSVIDPAATAAAREAFGVPLTSALFVAVGELNRNKRQADIVAALAQMKNREARLILLGDGDARPVLEVLVAKLGLTDRVAFGGLVADVRPLLAGATALVHPSKREGLSRAVMEALALEVPVIASAARGNAELVGDDGVIVPIGDVAGLARAMDRFASEPEAARALGRRARPRIVERYDIRAIIARHVDLYDGLVAARRGR
ncbi:MAG TPA: glycosyltransferase family 4 protein [Candidatus Limnocylindrales bacterium]